MRGVLHFATAIALLSAFHESPFAHFHANESEHSHAHGSGHAHWDDHDGHDEPVWEAEEANHDARLMDWLAGDGSADSRMMIVLPSAAHEMSWQVEVYRNPAPSPCNHDPPGQAGLPSRAPPQ